MLLLCIETDNKMRIGSKKTKHLSLNISYHSEIAANTEDSECEERTGSQLSVYSHGTNCLHCYLRLLLCKRISIQVCVLMNKIV